MAQPFTWENIPKSQTDPTTIEQAIADAIEVHNADIEAHMAALGSLAAHRANDIIDHPALSILADKLENNPVELGKKVGVGPLWGDDLQAATVDETVGYYRVHYTNIDGGKWFAFGSGGKVSTSSDGETWTTQTVAAISGYNEFVYGNGIFIAKREFAGSPLIKSSTDGINWVDSDYPGTYWFRTLRFTNNKFFICDPISNPGTIYSSENGVNWTLELSMPDGHPTDIIYIQDYGYIFDGWEAGPTNYLYYTEDFQNLEIKGSTTIDALEYFVEGNGQYALTCKGVDDGKLGFYTSKNGTTWTKHENITDPGPTKILFGLQQFIMIVVDIGDPAAMYTTNFSNAVEGTLPPGFYMQDCADNGERVVCVNGDAVGPTIMYADLPGAT